MASAMRIGGVAATVVWSMAAFTVLVILAISISGTWVHIALGGGAAIDLVVAALTLRFLGKTAVTVTPR
jgi:hypothetical protein